MTWEQKLQAAQALSECSLKMREPGNWYVSQSGVERKEGGCLSSAGGCNGASPEVAVEEFWNWLIDHKYTIILGAYTDTRRAVKWNGFMWKDVRE